MADVRLAVVVTVLPSNGEGCPHGLFLSFWVIFFCGGIFLFVLLHGTASLKTSPCKDKSTDPIKVMCQELIQRRKALVVNRLTYKIFSDVYVR
jgi:hypothetical protein